MSETGTRSRWQSMIETLALVFAAGTVGWAALVRPPYTVAPQRPPLAARKAEPPIPTQPLPLGDAATLGDKQAKTAIVMYSDFQCPFCGRFARETLPALRSKYVVPGKILLVFRQFPLPMHNFAEKAAEAAECAGEQGRFWPFHDELFANQDSLDDESLQHHAADLHLSADAFDRCLDGHAAARVAADRTSGGQLGVSATPTFFIGRLVDGKSVKVAKRLSGALPEVQFAQTLDPIIAADERTGSGKLN